MDQALLELRPGGAKFIQRVSNANVFRAYMLVKAPVLGVTGASLKLLNTHGARLWLPYSKRVQNLFGGLFGAAVVAGAEIAAASMLVLHIRNQGAQLTADLVAMDYRVLHPVAEDLSVFAYDGARYASFVERATRAQEPVEETFEVTAGTKHGEETHKLHMTWRLVPKP